MAIGIRKFNIENIKPYSTILIIGDHNKLLDDILVTDNPITTIQQDDDLVELKDHIKRQKEYLHGSKKRTSYIVLDNCFHSKSREFWNLLHILTNRNALLQNNTILIINKPNQTILTEVDYVFVCNTNNTRLLYQYYLPNLSTHFETFTDIYQQITNQPHQCIVLDHTQYKPTIANSITWYKSTSSS